MYVKRLFLSIIIIFIIVFSSTIAQDGACPALVQSALTTVDEVCSGIERNEICYGHGNITALDFESIELPNFATSGDTHDITTVYSLATSPMDAERDVWGVAVMSVQANLPGIAAGSNVTFVVFGDTKLVNEVPPDTEASEPPPTITLTSTGNINMRSGPGTGYSVTGVLSVGEEVTAVGRNEVGDWAQIDYGEITSWVYVPLMTVADGDDIMSLLVLQADESLPISYDAPMQAFSFTTGVGEVQCNEAPKDGLLIQAPNDTVVNFLINGIEIEVGSTALLQLEDEVLGVNTFDGLVNVTSQGKTESAEPGQRVDVVQGQAPSEAVAYDVADVNAAPVDLLPEAVHIPPPAGSRINVFGCAGWDPNGVGATTATFGQPLALNGGWLTESPEKLIEFENAVRFALVYDGVEQELWQALPLDGSGKRWWWVIPEPTTGTHEVVLFMYVEGYYSETVDGELLEWTVGEVSSWTCNITVQ